MPKARARIHGDFAEDGHLDVQVPIVGTGGDKQLDTDRGILRVKQDEKTLFVPLTSILYIEMLES